MAPTSTTANNADASVIAAPRGGGDQSAEIASFERAVVEFFLEAADLLGVPKSVAAIYGIIFASPQPLSFADVEQRLAISKGSVSQGLRVLREVGAINVAGAVKTVTDGTASPALHGKSQDRAPARRDLYVPDLELRKLVSHFLDKRLSRHLEAGKMRLTALDEAVPKGPAGEVLRGRMKSLKDWHRKTRALMPVAKAFLKVS